MGTTDRDRWDTKYRARGSRTLPPAACLQVAARWLPAGGSALDVAGGAGRNAIWLARRGFDVTITDVSRVGLALARGAAEAAGVELQTLEHDADRDALPPGPWDVIVCIDFLWRRLFLEAPRALAPGGVLIVCHPTRTNLERHAKPSARFLLRDGELATLVRGLDEISYEEGWDGDGRHTARLVARAGPRDDAR